MDFLSCNCGQSWCPKLGSLHLCSIFFYVQRFCGIIVKRIVQRIHFSWRKFKSFQNKKWLTLLVSFLFSCTHLSRAMVVETIHQKCDATRNVTEAFRYVPRQLSENFKHCRDQLWNAISVGESSNELGLLSSITKWFVIAPVQNLALILPLIYTLTLVLGPVSPNVPRPHAWEPEALRDSGSRLPKFRIVTSHLGGHVVQNSLTWLIQYQFRAK